MATGLFNLKQVNQAISQGAWSGYIAPRWVEYLVVAGGGGAGSGNSGGGGAGGGLLTGIVTVATGVSYTVTVGAGGSGGVSGSGSTGVSSVFGAISAVGGGFGGGNVTGGLGGSGGGGGGDANTVGGQGTAGQGNAGGRGANTTGTTPFVSGGGVFAGGGGGAGTIGLTYTAGPPGRSGNGGAGIASSIAGTVTTFSGGGGGGGDGRSVGGAGGSGGVGGGGNGSLLLAGGAGGGNTGGGGGGGGYNPSTFYDGGAGGSGIVVVRYPGNVVFFTGGTVNYNNGYIIHIFTSNGTLAPTTPAPYNTSYQISRSLRFNRADTNTLTRTPATAGSRTTYSLSFWIKNPFLSGSDNPVWGQFSISRESLSFSGFSYSNNPIVWIPFTGFEYRTTQGFRDDSAWYHVVAVGDSTNATAADRARLYINGVRVTAFDASPTITQNSQTGQLNTAVLHYIGQQWSGDGGLAGFSLTEMNFIDGQALTPSSFGATSTTTGVWAPIQYTGTYGTNGFYINFSDNSNTTAATLGKDYSGNGNNWTPNNFSVTAGAGNDSLVDSPTQYGFDTGVGGTVRGNYATLNPLLAITTSSVTNPTLANGNLSFVGNATTDTSGRSTIGVTSGKWYCEVTLSYVSAAQDGLGIAYTQSDSSRVSGVLYRSSGDKCVNNTVTAYGTNYVAGSLIGIALDADNNTVTFYNSNNSQGAISFTPTTAIYFSSYGTNTTPAFAGDFNFGQRPFVYTAPSGFKALCTQNLPTPTIGATSNSLATQFFNPVLWTGTGVNLTVTGVGFQPDAVWIKSRSNASNHELYDVVRGIGTTSYTLFPNLTNAESANTGSRVSAVNSDGFNIFGGAANLNQSGYTYVAWNWRAGNNAGASNSAGTITSTVSANTTSGFSVVTWTGNSGSGTVGHGLGVAPAMYIVKNRTNAGGWVTYHSALGATKYLTLQSTDAATTSSIAWNDTAPTSSVFSIASGAFGNTNNYVTYCFAPIAGYSAFGSYTGNGSADGPFVYTGFRPAFVMIKNTTTAQDWMMFDSARNTYNATNLYLQPNQSSAEASGIGDALDFLSNGLKIKSTNGTVNTSTNVYIFMCFASNPFKYSLAR